MPQLVLRTSPFINPDQPALPVQPPQAEVAPVYLPEIVHEVRNEEGQRAQIGSRDGNFRMTAPKRRRRRAGTKWCRPTCLSRRAP